MSRGAAQRAVTALTWGLITTLAVSRRAGNSRPARRWIGLRRGWPAPDPHCVGRRSEKLGARHSFAAPRRHGVVTALTAGAQSEPRPARGRGDLIARRSRQRQPLTPHRRTQQSHLRRHGRVRASVGSEPGPIDVDDGGGDGRPVVGAGTGALLDLDPAGAVDGQPVDDVVRVVASEDIVRPGHPDADPGPRRRDQDGALDLVLQRGGRVPPPTMTPSSSSPWKATA